MKIPWFKTKDKTLPYDAVLKTESERAELDRYSPTWRFIEGWAKDTLSAEREKNDVIRHNEVATAYIRGRISLLKEIAELPETGRKRPVLTDPPNAGYGE